MIPSPSGHIGAWLVTGPVRADEEARIVAALGSGLAGAAVVSSPSRGGPRGGSAWRLAAANEGVVDLRAALPTRERDVVAYAALRLDVSRPTKLLLLLGASDGVRVLLDGEAIDVRDEARPMREDDHVVPLVVREGVHTLALRLRVSTGPWLVRARLVDEAFRPPEAVRSSLPGVPHEAARAASAGLVRAALNRGVRADGYAPELALRFPDGALGPSALRVRVTLAARRARAGAPNQASRGTRAPEAPCFDVDAGIVPRRGSSPGSAPVAADYVVRLPSPPPSCDEQDLVYEARLEEDGTNAVVRSFTFPFSPRSAVRRALGEAERTLAATAEDAPFLREGGRATLELLRDRLAAFVDQGDTDTASQLEEARALERASRAIAQRADPFDGGRGAMRLAFRSRIDGRPSEFALYVPPGERAPRTKLPLIVALHGLNGRPMAMLQHLFGFDDPNRDGVWEDRHPVPLPTLGAIVLAPSAFGNAMYREMGEEDVMDAIAWVRRNHAIDDRRITITGPSMGGTGTSAIAFRHPSLFAAAAPLCGYHSYFVRADMRGKPLLPWERFLAEERSPAEWAWNGQSLPLYVVHGTQDQPIAHSGVLIDRYLQLKYAIRHEHPNLGHNVWQPTYEALKGAKWLLSFARDEHPKSVRIRTTKDRYGDSSWVHLEGIASPGGWGEVEATVRTRRLVEVRTKNVSRLRLDRDRVLLDAEAPIDIDIDGQRLRFSPEDPLALHHDGTRFQKGASSPPDGHKHGAITGPLRDVFHQPIVFVYGASDARHARVNEEVARAWARVRPGVTVRYPIMSDVDFLARGEAVGNDRSLFLVGDGRSNLVTRALEPKLPARIEGDALVFGGTRFTGASVGAAFIRPNPARPDRYVVVVEGVEPRGTFRALALPDLLPDFVVFDDDVANARGQMVLGSAKVRAAGFFGNDWSLPSLSPSGAPTGVSTARR